jgi:uncharacterized protein
MNETNKSNNKTSLPLVCTTCKKPIADPSLNPYFPFCSERCRLIDLSKWLDEKSYTIPDKK